MSSFSRDARVARAAWGTTDSVVVAVGDLGAGEVIEPDDVRLEHRPTALVPEDALRELPLGRRLTTAVPHGEIVIGSRVTPRSTGANGAALSGDAALATVPRSTPFGGEGPTLSEGDRVDLYASGPGESAFGAGMAATNVASDAVVHELRGADVTIRIRRTEAQAVASALLSGSLTLVVVG